MTHSQILSLERKGISTEMVVSVINENLNKKDTSYFKFWPNINIRYGWEWSVDRKIKLFFNTRSPTKPNELISN